MKLIEKKTPQRFVVIDGKEYSYRRLFDIVESLNPVDLDDHEIYYMLASKGVIIPQASKGPNWDSFYKTLCNLSITYE